MSNIPNLVMMIRPASFGFNSETSFSNSFQKKREIQDVSQKAIDEFDQMVNSLMKNGINVKVFDDLRHDLPDSVFSNNWIAQFPQGQIYIFPMFTPNRRREVREDIPQWMQSKFNGVVTDLTKRAEEGIFLEGTGSMVFDHDYKIGYACISPRTDIKLFEKLCNDIGYQPVSFESHDLQGKEIYHTNVMMAVASKFVIICLESIPDILERQMVKKVIERTGKELIEISFNQMNAFCGNCFEMENCNGEPVLVMSETSKKAFNIDQLRRIKEDSQVLSIEIPTIESIGGGSVRCMMTGLFDR